MKAMILAAGLGTRLKPLTDDKPKALVEVAGRPLVEWQILRLYSYGFADIVINVHHFGDMVEKRVKEFLEREEHPCLNISFSEEFDLLRDTGGGIRHASDLLSDGEPFLDHNVDILSDMDIEEFYSSCRSKMEEDEQIISYVLVTGRYSDRRLLFDNTLRLKGWENIKTGEVKSQFGDIAGLQPFAFGGVHVLSPKALEIMKSWPEKFSIVDFYLQNSFSSKVMGEFLEDATIIDVGRLENLPKAEEFMKEML